MGNHEFCTDCGASDFHHGHPCNPVRKAEYQAGLDEGRRAKQEGIAKLTTICNWLQNLGIPAELDDGMVKIKWWNLK